MWFALLFDVWRVRDFGCCLSETQFWFDESLDSDKVKGVANWRHSGLDINQNIGDSEIDIFVCLSAIIEAQNEGSDWRMKSEKSRSRDWLSISVAFVSILSGIENVWQ